MSKVGKSLLLDAKNYFDTCLMELHKKVVVDESGTPQEVIIPWAEFQQLQEILGLNEEIEISPEWQAEVEKRLADIDAGRVKLVRSEDVFEHVESALKNV